LNERFNLSTGPVAVGVECDFGSRPGGLATLAPEVPFDKIIAEHDHIYIVVEDGRAEEALPKPGTPDTVYWLYLSKGPWPVANNTGDSLPVRVSDGATGTGREKRRRV
jgi:hypothetical protein